MFLFLSLTSSLFSEDGAEARPQQIFTLGKCPTMMYIYTLAIEYFFKTISENKC